MDPQHDLRVWIKQHLKRQGRGSSHRLARFLNVDPHTVTRMKNVDGLKETRRIEADMIPKLAAFFGCIPPGFRTLNKFRCANCTENGNIHRKSLEAAMPGSKERPIKIEINTPQQGTLIVGDNATVTTNNYQIVGLPISPKQTLELDKSVRKIAESRDEDADAVWKQLCSTLEIADSALLTKELFPAAQKILHSWEQEAVRSAVNKKG